MGIKAYSLLLYAYPSWGDMGRVYKVELPQRFGQW